jgi:uncharacterized surface protein with fasciclin (FAS1) repeats
MKQINILTAVLVIIGALNWGLVGVARFDLVATLFGLSFGETSTVTTLVYTLVGLAGLYQLLAWKSIRAMSAVAAALAVASVVAPHAVRAQNATVVETAVAAGSFKTLAKAIEAADLVTTLNGSGPFTVFAPTDDAFAKLPAGTVDNLLKPENKEKLRRLLTSHVVAGKVMAADVVKLESVKTASGDTVAIRAQNGMVRVSEARVTKTDIQASNGVIHVIDTVILPKGL